MNSGVIYSCVVDRSPLFLYQSLVWAHSLIELAGRSPSEVVVHAVRGCDPEHLAALRRLGVGVVEVQPVDPRNPYANKLAQLGSAALSDAEYVVFCDSDLAFVDDITAYIHSAAMRAKIVDHSQPTLREWRPIVELAGMSSQLAAAQPTHSDVPTWNKNFNAGLLVLPQEIFQRLGPAWPRWHGWVQDNAAALQRRTVIHAVQVGLALSVEELGLDTEALPVTLNFPTHVPYAGKDRQQLLPTVLHYHDRLDASGAITPTQMRGVDSAIARANKLLRGLSDDADFTTGLRRWQSTRAEHRPGRKFERIRG